MPLYKYDSFSRRGAKLSGTIDAPSEQAAKEMLRGQGLMPIAVTEVSSGETGISFASLFEKPVDSPTVIRFTKQMAVLLKSSVPLLQALELMVEQFEGKFKRVLITIKDEVKSGEAFAKSLAKYPKIFPNVYVQLVRAGEASGKLDLIMNRLIDYLVKAEETKKSIKKAMSYPIMMISFAVLVVAGMLAFLVPRMESMFSKMGKGGLPAPTQLLVNMSHAVTNNYIIIGIVFFASAFFLSYWRSTPNGKYKIDSFFLWLPLTSYFSRTKAVIQFSKTLGLLLDSGVNLSEALDIVCNIVDNSVLTQKLKDARDKIIKEGKIAKYLKDTGIFPSIASYMINTGEQSGKLAEMLLTVGNDYEIELSELTDSLTSKITPIMTVVMGLIVGFIVISIFLPIMQMGELSGM
jgi:type II secretory pathway component PulF